MNEDNLSIWFIFKYVVGNLFERADLAPLGALGHRQIHGRFNLKTFQKCSTDNSEPHFYDLLLTFYNIFILVIIWAEHLTFSSTVMKIIKKSTTYVTK